MSLNFRSLTFHIYSKNIEAGPDGFERVRTAFSGPALVSSQAKLYRMAWAGPYGSYDNICVVLVRYTLSAPCLKLKRTNSHYQLMYYCISLSGALVFSWYQFSPFLRTFYGWQFGLSVDGHYKPLIPVCTLKLNFSLHRVSSFITVVLPCCGTLNIQISSRHNILVFWEPQQKIHALVSYCDCEMFP